MTNSRFNQFDIYWVDLEPVKGAETKKNRPCVVLQSTLVNRASKTLLVAPILPNHKDWPFSVNVIPSKYNGIDKERHVNLKQIRAVDISRIGKKQGVLEDRYFPNIKKAIELVFGLV